MKKPVILMILDGFGIAPEKGNAIKAAKKPNIDKLLLLIRSHRLVRRVWM